MEIRSKSAEKTPEGHLITHNIIDSNNDCNLSSILLDGEDVFFLDKVIEFNKKINYIIDYYKDIVNEFYIITYGEVYSDVSGKKLESIKSIFKKKGLYHRFFIRTSSNKNTFKCNFQTSLFWLGKNIDKIQNPSSDNIERHFLSLCRKVDYHRERVFFYLKEKNLLEKSFYSFAANDKKNKYHKSIEGYELSWDTSQNHTKIINEYRKSFVNLNTETLYNSDINFLTEKTNKCFLSAQPFIMISSPKTLKYLKELGFKTFDKWWDESYDNEIDGNKRLKKIFKIIDEISSKTINECKYIYNEMIPILKHNQQNLIRINKNQVDSTFYLYTKQYYTEYKSIF